MEWVKTVGKHVKKKKKNEKKHGEPRTEKKIEASQIASMESERKRREKKVAAA